MIVAEGLELKRVYYLRGQAPRGARLRNAVGDPPHAGWSHAFVLPGEKRSTLFCPYSLEAHVVPNRSMEISTAEEPDGPFDPAFWAELLPQRWEQAQRHGFLRDYDVCALVMKKLGLDIPPDVLRGGEQDTRKRGGKETGTALKKPVKAASKRGKFLQWFLEDGGTRSVREAMAEFGMSRSNALSYLFMLQKDHGIGYSLTGDRATVTLPDGCSDPFDQPPKEEPAAVAEDDDSWLD